MENYLPCYEKNYCERTEKNAVCELNLAEYLPNASKIIRVSAVAVCDGCEIMRDSVNVHGQVKFSVIYLSDFRNRLKCALGECEFSHSFPAKGIEEAVKDSGFVDCTVSVSEEKGQVISQRKLSASCKVQICVQTITEKKTEIFDIAEKDGIHKLCSEAEYVRLEKLKNINAVIEENISLEEGMPEIKEIVSCECNISSLHTQCNDGKIKYRGKVNLCCLYLSGDEDGEEYISFSKDIDFSGDSDAQGIPDGSFIVAGASVVSSGADPVQNNYGELSVCSVSAELCISATAYCVCRAGLVCDAFSTKYDCGCEVKNTVYDRIVRGSCENASITEKLHANLGSITDIASKSVYATVTSAEISGKTPVYNIKAILKIMGTNESGGLECMSTQFSFKVHSENELDFIPERYRADAEVFVNGCDAKIENGEIICSLSLEICSCIYERSSQSAVTAMVIDTETEICRNKSEYLLYYPCANDTVWSCAKKYRIAPEELIAINGMGLFDTGFGDKKVVVIPSSDE